MFFQEFIGQTIRVDVVTSKDDGAHFSAAKTIAAVPTAPLAGSGPKGGAVPPPLLGAATDLTSGASAVAIAAQDEQAGHPVIEMWESRSSAWRGPFRPVSGAEGALSQQQPRLLFARGRLYVSFFAISRQGQISEQLADGALNKKHFRSETLSGSAFRANGFFGDYQALAGAGVDGYALWNDSRSGRLEIVADRFRMK